MRLYGSNTKEQTSQEPTTPPSPLWIRRQQSDRSNCIAAPLLTPCGLTSSRTTTSHRPLCFHSQKREAAPLLTQLRIGLYATSFSSPLQPWRGGLCRHRVAKTSRPAGPTHMFYVFSFKNKILPTSVVESQRQCSIDKEGTRSFKHLVAFLDGQNIR